MKTIPEIVSTIKAHLLKQMTIAVKNGACQYHTEDGLMCAVGCLITPKCYSFDIENRTIAGAIGRKTRHHQRPGDKSLFEALTCSEIDMDSIVVRNCLIEAQNIHDNYSPKDWPVLLADFQEKYANA